MQILCQLICKNGIFSSEVTKIVFMKRMATLLNSETVKDLLDQEFLDKEWLKVLLSRFREGGDLHHHDQKICITTILMLHRGVLIYAVLSLLQLNVIITSWRIQIFCVFINARFYNLVVGYNIQFNSEELIDTTEYLTL